MAKLSNQLYVNVVESLVLTRYSFSENVVDEPVQVDCGLLPLLFCHFLLISVFGPVLSDCHKIFQLLKFLLEVVLARVIALELD